jgi:hypothetical protein
MTWRQEMLYHEFIAHNQFLRSSRVDPYTQIQTQTQANSISMTMKTMKRRKERREM